MKPYALLSASALAAFCRNESGSFATIMGVTVMAVAMCAGIAVDFSRMAHTRTVVDSALDAAVLSTGSELSRGTLNPAQLRKHFEDHFFANIDDRSLQADGVEITSFKADKASGAVMAEANAEISMAFMGLAGFDKADVRSTAEAVFSNDRVELAMMLDVTGSMGERGKLGALKLAASEAVSILMPQKTPDPTIRISLVPYSVSVNAGPYAALASSRPALPFVTERWGDAKFSDDAPVSPNKMGAAANSGPSQAILPLGSDPAPLQAAISRFRAGGGTAGHLGVAWSYYTLSPNWNGIWPSASQPARYREPNVKKVALLMTDGEFNTIYPPAGSKWNSSQFAVELCKSMKRDGIIIYSVAFDAPAYAQKTLKDCASPDSGGENHFFNAGDGEELSQAFRKIALDIQKLRLAR